MNLFAPFRTLTARQRHAFAACFLGWSLDAFDYFILVFCVSAIATDFKVAKSAVTEAYFLTLAFRPLGALLFGWMADRFGRRPTLMVNILCYSVLELACAFTPSLHVLLARPARSWTLGGKDNFVADQAVAGQVAAAQARVSGLVHVLLAHRRRSCSLASPHAVVLSGAKARRCRRTGQPAQMAFARVT